MVKIKSILGLVFLLSLVSCDQLKSVKVIRLGHGLSTGHSVHQGMVYFGEQLEKISEGKYPISFLISGPSLIASLPKIVTEPLVG